MTSAPEAQVALKKKRRKSSSTESESDDLPLTKRASRAEGSFHWKSPPFFKAGRKDMSRKAKTPSAPEEEPPEAVVALKKKRISGLAYAKVTKEEGVALRRVALEDSLFHRGGVDYDTQVEVVDTATTALGTTYFLVNQHMTGQTGWINKSNVALTSTTIAITPPRSISMMLNSQANAHYHSEAPTDMSVAF